MLSLLASAVSNFGFGWIRVSGRIIRVGFGRVRVTFRIPEVKRNSNLDSVLVFFHAYRVPGPLKDSWEIRRKSSLLYSTIQNNVGDSWKCIWLHIIIYYYPEKCRLRDSTLAARHLTSQNPLDLQRKCIAIQLNTSIFAESMQAYDYTYLYSLVQSKQIWLGASRPDVAYALCHFTHSIQSVT